MSVNEQPSAGHSCGLLITHGHPAQCTAVAIVSCASQNILFRSHVTNEHAFLSAAWMLTSTSGPQQVKMWQTTYLPFAIWVIGCFLSLTGGFGILWSFLVPTMIHSTSNTCKPWDFVFPFPQYCVNATVKESDSGLKIIPVNVQRYLGCPEHSVLHQPLWFHHHLNFFICFFSWCSAKWKSKSEQMTSFIVERWGDAKQDEIYRLHVHLPLLQ